MSQDLILSFSDGRIVLSHVDTSDYEWYYQLTLEIGGSAIVHGCDSIDEICAQLGKELQEFLSTFDLEECRLDSEQWCLTLDGHNVIRVQRMESQLGIRFEDFHGNVTFVLIDKDQAEEWMKNLQEFKI